MEEHTKKLLIYGGAGASIIALLLYVKNKQGAAAAAGYAPSTGTGTSAGGGASSDALSAAQINSATQLAIAQGNQANQLATIQAQQGIVTAQIAGAVKVADIQASAVKTSAVVSGLSSAGGSALAGGALKQITDLITNIVNKAFGTTSPDGTKLGFVGAADEPVKVAPDLGYSSPGSSFLTPASYGVTGNIFGIGYTPGADYFQGSIGSGDSSYFGTSPGENTVLPSDFVNSTTAPDTGAGIPSGYQD